MRIEETKNLLKSDGMRALFGKMYGQSAVEENIARYEDLVEKFRKEFGDKDILLFSSPGRTEISGNHTDHNNGKVLAGSIN